MVDKIKKQPQPPAVVVVEAVLVEAEETPGVAEIVRPGSTFASRAAARGKRIGSSENKAVSPGESLVSSKTLKGG